MTFTLKKGQTLADIFLPNQLTALFPDSSSEKSKKLNAGKYVGILKFHGTSQQLQKQLRDEWH
jgi:hypothetical protein